MRVRYHLLVAALIAILMASSFVAGWQFQAAASPHGSRDLARLVAALVDGGSRQELEDVSLRPLETFQEVLNHLRKDYVSPIKDETKLTHYAIQGMLAALREAPYEDRYTRFMEPEEYRGFLDENQGHFGGIGAEIGVRESEDEEPALHDLPPGLRCPNCGAEVTAAKRYHIVVVAPLPGSPAERAGLRPGDEILKVDGVLTAGLSLGETVKRIKGRPGTVVTLTLRRKGRPQPWEVKITREVIQVRSVEWKLLPDKIGYLRISTFNETTPDLVKKGLRELREGGMRALLLDLRGNAGGELDACVETAGQFIGSGPVVYIEERGKPRKVRTAGNGASRISVPLVVLINNGSASASEILAGAIQDGKLGVLMGTRTFGKGLVQTVYPLRDGSALALTTARYLTPSLRDIDKKGIQPDIAVEQPESKETILPLSERDEQAKAALKYLREQVAARLRSAA